MASPKSVLSAIGHFLAKVFSPSAIKLEATIADIAFPQFSFLINATASAIINAENAAIAAGVQTGSGAQKSAIVIAQMESAYTTFANTNNIPIIPANIKNFVDAMVAALNSFPPPNTSAPEKP